jgi:hypothetical protein
VEQWEYRVVSLRDGHYTESLNAYGREGWELVTVVRDEPAPAPPAKGRSLPVPGALGKLETAAETIGKLGGPGAADDPGTTSLLWVLRRPLPDAD